MLTNEHICVKIEIIFTKYGGNEEIMMKKSTKKAISCLMAVVVTMSIITTLPLTSNAASCIKTQAEAVDWLNAQDGAWYDLDGAWGAQCSDFASAYINYLLYGRADIKINEGGFGKVLMAYAYADMSLYPSDWQRFDNTASFVPQPGDIFINQSVPHVGVVISSDVNTALIVDQNSRAGYGDGGTSAWVKTITWKAKGSGGSYAADYFVRPAFSNLPEKVTPAKPIVTASDIGNKVHLEWNACSNADYYDVRIYDENEQVVLVQYGVKATSFDYPLNAGTYRVSVAAVNNNTNYMFSDYVYFTIAEHTHIYGAWNTVTAATCMSAGTEKRTCSCGATEQRSVNALGHNYSTEWTVDVTPTETTAGIKSHHCIRCNAKTNVTAIQATGTQDVSKKFVDITPDAWYVSAVQYAVEHNIFSGVSPTEFAPNTPMTRAMLVTVLWRMDGRPTESMANPFMDVPSGQWYADAVQWAASNGIVYGVSNDKFDPNGNITREQMAAILYRYAEKKGHDVSKADDLNAFPDGKDASDYAKEALAWAYGEKLITGVKTGNTDYLDPRGGATRAQVASILMRYAQNIANK